MQSEPGLWHGSWRQDSLDGEMVASEGLAYVWEETETWSSLLKTFRNGFHLSRSDSKTWL